MAAKAGPDSPICCMALREAKWARRAPDTWVGGSSTSAILPQPEKWRPLATTPPHPQTQEKWVVEAPAALWWGDPHVCERERAGEHLFYMAYFPPPMLCEFLLEICIVVTANGSSNIYPSPSDPFEKVVSYRYQRSQSSVASQREPWDRGGNVLPHPWKPYWINFKCL